MSSIFTRSNMNSIKFDLKRFCLDWNIDMGIDESDNRPYVVKYIFQCEGYGCTVEIDFTQIVDINETVESIEEEINKHIIARLKERGEIVDSIKEEINKHIIGRLGGKKSDESKVTTNKRTC